MFCLNCDCVLIISLYQIRFYVRSTKFSSVIQSNLARKRPPKIQQIDLVVAHREVVVFKNRTTRVGGRVALLRRDPRTSTLWKVTSIHQEGSFIIFSSDLLLNHT